VSVWTDARNGDGMAKKLGNLSTSGPRTLVAAGMRESTGRQREAPVLCPAVAPAHPGGLISLSTGRRPVETFIRVGHGGGRRGIRASRLFSPSREGYRWKRGR
jgi:hypothetical protein